MEPEPTKFMEKEHKQKDEEFMSRIHLKNKES